MPLDAMMRCGVRLQYEIEGDASQGGADIEHPLFDLLGALQTHGSIHAAAKAQRRSYRFVWGQLKHWEGALGMPLIDWVQGRRAALTPFALRLLWAERQARVRMTPHIEGLRAELQHALAATYDIDTEVLEVFASHDLALPNLQELVAQRRLHLSLRFIGSQDALRALRDGRCHVAGFHVPRFSQVSPLFACALRPLLHPGEHKLIASHRREQGLMQRPGDVVVRSLSEVAMRQLRFVNRQVGSGTRLLADHLVHAASIKPDSIDGFATRIEHTHVAVAAAVAAGAGDVGLGVRAAAHAMGLDFVPLVEEDYHLVCLKRMLDTPAVVRLREALASDAWRAALESMPGCVPQRSGEVLSLTRALPWWRQLKDRAKPVHHQVAA